MRAQVVVQAIEGPQKGREFAFDKHDTFIFGRAADCSCSIPNDPFLSSQHFLLEVNPPECDLRDLGSKNGTFVNGNRFAGKPLRLRNGDVVKAGSTQFSVAVRSFLDCEACRKEFEAPANSPSAPRFCPACGAAEPKLGNLTNFMAGIVKPMEAEKPPAFPGYTVVKSLGIGGMGTVYLARRDADGRQVVMKVVRPRGRDVTDQESKLFRREMGLALALKHPNIVEFVADGSAQGALFFVMEFCDQGSAAALMERSGGRLELRQAATITLQALAGLEYAHSKQIVHRDLKPANILLAGAGGGLTAKIADFGLAKNFNLAGLSGMTFSGAEGGTSAFMPKEQLKDYRHAKPVSDVFSMAASFYNMLTNEIVYDFRGVDDPCIAILKDRLVPIQKRGLSLPPEVADVIGRALLPDAGKRYQTAGEFGQALARAISV